MSTLNSPAPKAAAESGAEVDARDDSAFESPIEADHLMEEVSIDGMCGVY